jgi:hypothetical protein
VLKKFIFTHTSENISKFQIDYVWENAQDLEHVSYLHGNTNFNFLLFSHDKKLNNDNFLYNSLSFLVKRKLFGFIPITTFGYRKIESKYEIFQLEYSPIINVYSFLHSTLIDLGETTLMRDKITLEFPFYFKIFAKLLPYVLNRHTRIQCLEDESFRSRRVDLKSRNIYLPLRFFNVSKFNYFLNFNTKKLLNNNNNNNEGT